MNTVVNEPLADSLADAAKRMGISRGLVYKLAKAGKLRLTRIAGRTLVLRAEQQRLLTEATSSDAA